MPARCLFARGGSRSPAVSSKRDSEDQVRAQGEEQELAVEVQAEECRVRRQEQQRFNQERPTDRPYEEWRPLNKADHRQEHDAERYAVGKVIRPAERLHEPARFGVSQ